MRTIVTGLIVGAIGARSAVTPAISQPVSKWEPTPTELKFVATYRAELKKRMLDADSDRTDQVLVEVGRTECGLVEELGKAEWRWYRESGAFIPDQPGIVPEHPEKTWRGKRGAEVMAIYRDKPEILKIEIAKIETMFEALLQTDYCHSFDE
jgi:hypothetical protein